MGVGLRGRIEKKLELLQKSGETLESFFYLLHHVHVSDNGDEELHHCPVVDHLGNRFRLDHVKGDDGKIYHAVTELEEDQDVYWSEEEAIANGEDIPCANRQL